MVPRDTRSQGQPLLLNQRVSFAHENHLGNVIIVDEQHVPRAETTETPAIEMESKTNREKNTRLTCILPHTLLHQPIMRKTFLTYERVSRCRRSCCRFVVPEERIRKFVVPLFPGDRDWLLGLCCLHGFCGLVSVEMGVEMDVLHVSGW